MTRIKGQGYLGDLTEILQSMFGAISQLQYPT